jgi:hypothetical protein
MPLLLEYSLGNGYIVPTDFDSHGTDMASKWMESMELESNEDHTYYYSSREVGNVDCELGQR